MKLTKQQRAQLQSKTQRAAVAALREHFTGEGAASRSLRFMRGALMASAGWTAKLLFVGSWAVIGGLLAGPEHDFLLKQVHTWMVATPVDQVLMQSHAMFVSAAIECVKIGLLLGFGQKLLSVVTPAVQQAKQSFTSVAA
ncbi:MAG: hypothetical protein B7X52_01060 [Thiotrichales bacterium 34-46-19]|nr:MAG: hypothetical protein B7X52_01060 [Thiotrichales bacterium 34-46-19]